MLKKFKASGLRARFNHAGVTLSLQSWYKESLKEKCTKRRCNPLPLYHMQELCCKNNPDSFCYVCDVFSPQKQRQKISSAIREGYEICFQIKPKNGKKYWIPNSCCSTCVISLRSVYRGDFDHLFRFIYSSKWKDSIIYPNVSSVTKATYNPKDSISGNFTKRKSGETNYSDENQTMEHEPTRNLPQLFDQKGLNNLIRDLSLSKSEAEILGSRLKERNLLEKDVKGVTSDTAERAKCGPAYRLTYLRILGPWISQGWGSDSGSILGYRWSHPFSETPTWLEHLLTNRAEFCRFSLIWRLPRLRIGAPLPPVEVTVKIKYTGRTNNRIGEGTPH